jgi:hypothetical protein
MTTERKTTRSKPPTREQMEHAAKAAYEFRFEEIDFLVPYKDLMEQANVYADQIKEAVSVVSNDEVLANMAASAAVNRFRELN